METSTLRPGLLVSLKTSIKGNTKYRTTDLGTKREGDIEESRWETERTTLDKAEQERAVKAKSLARSKVQGVCIPSDFGLLCPKAKADELDRAVSEARAIANEFNATANVTRLSIRIIRGEIADNDVEAIRAINSEISELMASMAEGLSNLDVQKVRDAANKVRAVGGMLTDSAKERVQVAIDLARSAARKIKAAGETGAAEIDRATIARIQAARSAFLDLDEGEEIETVAQEGRGIDLEPEDRDWTKQTIEEIADRNGGLPIGDEPTVPVQRRMFDLD